MTGRVFSVCGLLILVGMFSLSSSAYTDVVHLNYSSKPVNGHVVSVNEQEVLVQTKEGTQLPISRPAVEDIEFKPSSAPVSSGPAFNTPKLDLQFLPSNQLMFPEESGNVNEKAFVTLSRFKGQSSKQVYAGLYNFPNKGTFWVRVPQARQKSGELQFSLFGKLNNQQPTEQYALKARFLDEAGNLIEESPVASFEGGKSDVLEWFNLLEGISGLSGKKDVSWRVPERTKTIEFRVISAEEESRHLVGYLSNLSLVIEE